MKSYPEYKDSGVKWIGRIPLEWDIKKLKYLIDGKLTYGANEVAEESNDENPRYIRITDFDNDGRLRDDTFKSLPFDLAKDYLLKEGDVLFARSGATVGKTFQFKNYNGIACFAGYLIKATPQSRKLDSDYLYFYTKSGIYENWKDSIYIQATIQNIGADKYSYLPLPLPSIHQQRIISLFLNQKTQLIDDLIEKKQRLIELLKEERTAIINQAVTKGLDPTVSMKDSGIEWLGEIPEHWMVKRLKFLVDNIIKKSNISDFKVALENIESWTGRFLTTGHSSELTGEMKSFKPKDILFNKLRPYLAKVYFPEVEGECVGELLVLRSKKMVIPKFLYYRLLSRDFIEVVNGSTYGAKMPRASWEDFIRNLIIPYPELKEQNKIVESIDKMTMAIADTIVKLEHEIELISEYKTSLINEAVTGKIDVRDYQINYA